MAFLVLMSFLQVALRSLFSSGILWADTLLRHLVLWVAFLGAGLAAASDRQFALDLSSRFLKGRIKSAVLLACHCFTVAACIFLARASILFFREEYAQGGALFSAGGFRVPAWAFELILPAGFALLALHYLIKAALAAAGDAGPAAKA